MTKQTSFYSNKMQIQFNQIKNWVKNVREDDYIEEAKIKHVLMLHLCYYIVCWVYSYYYKPVIFHMKTIFHIILLKPKTSLFRIYFDYLKMFLQNVLKSTKLCLPLSVCSCASEAISVMMEYFCSEAMIILVSLWFLCKLKWSSDEANMQMRTTPYGNIRRRLPATANTMSAVPLSSTNFIRQDVSDIMCDFVLANETPATRPGDEREAPGDEATWHGGGGGRHWNSPVHVWTIVIR